ncbi:MAG TPA: ABC transporter permease [Pseudonocardiaceae bacterium]|nr:ABC transporter permease [Pseudonocardiaceae bacterium]
MNKADVIVSEWHKVRSLRSSWYLIVASVGVLAAVSLVALMIVQEWDASSAQERASSESGNVVALIGAFAPYLLGCLAVLTVTGEYATRMISPSLAAVPRRGLFFTAKATVVAGIALVVGAALAFGALLLTVLIVGERPEPVRPWPAVGDGVTEALGLIASTVVIALVALALGTIMRASAGALITLAVLLYVLPSIVTLVPGQLGMWLGSVQLLNLAPQLTGQSEGMLPPAGAAAAMAGYVVLAMGGGYLALRRDA